MLIFYNLFSQAIGNYAFNYGIANGYGATNGRSEVGDAHGNKVGSYSITDIDGRARRVDYVADALGFRASVKTNEPGTALSAPAAAAVVSPYAAPVAPVAAAPVAAVAPAPVLAHAPIAPAAVTSYSTVVGHAAPVAAIPAAVSSYSTHIGHAAPVAAYSNIIGPAAIAAPIGHYGLGSAITKSIVY